MGYKPVKTYDPSVKDESLYNNADDSGYYSSAIDNETNEISFSKIDGIENRDSFAEALAEGPVYIKICNENEDGKLVWRGMVDSFSSTRGITTLAEYFHWLKELSEISTPDDPDYGRKFTRLPLDEPYFDINANDRSIAIPASFKKNGIAVQGDDLAEVVYFKINRYFDYMDFANCEIAIQWETPKGKDVGGATAESKASISRPYLVDIESEPGKLIFGWAISDVLTQVSGSLKFSVRFYQVENEKITYNFNTLTANATVKTGLNINLLSLSSEDIDDAGERLLERIESSQLVEGGYAAAVPRWIINLVEGEDYDLEPEGDTILEVEATADDTGMITYTWRRQGVTGGLPSRYEYRAVSESEFKPGQLYYVKTNGSDVYTVEYFDGESVYPGNNEIFRQVSCCTIDSAGTYYAEATNRITNSSETVMSNKRTYPLPEEPKIVNGPVTTAVIAGNYDTYYVEGDNTPKTAESPIELIVETKEVENNVPTYQWYNSTDGESWTEIGKTEKVYTVDAPGYYKMTMTNTRNKATSAVADSDICRVTYVPEPVQIGEIKVQRFSTTALTDVNCPTITIVNDSAESEGYVVEWYVYDIVGENVRDELIVTNKITDISDSFNPANYKNLIHKATEDANIVAKYYPKVYNVLNGVRSIPTTIDQDKWFEVFVSQNNVVTLSLDGEEGKDEDKLFFEE